MRLKLLPVLLFTAVTAFAQTSKDFAVLLTAQVQESPASITLKWPADNTSGVTYNIYRKAKNTVRWTDSLTTLDNTATQYTDANVSVGIVYEYWVKKNKASLSTTRKSADGYITAGIKIPVVNSRGKMILLIDQNYVLPLTNEITQLENDLIGDGWQLIRHDIARSSSVASVKSIVMNDYATQSNVVALFMLGRIPVPYSGAFGGSSSPPDGHPDHSGAWPADVYYGVMNSDMWTDNIVNDTVSGRTQNRNVPNDGKFDQIYLYPDSTVLQIGRVDLSNMPAFGISDTALIKRYLNKNHLFKWGIHKAERRGLVSDNFGAMAGEAFASTGYRAFSTMFGDSVTTVGGGGLYRTTMNTNSYLWAYGTGGGTYTGAGGIGTTSDMVNDSMLNVFSMLFGSYFGDWDSQNNFLRAPLAHKGWTLTNAWSGRPYWMFHPMALGENTGYCALITQNNIDGNKYLSPKINLGYTQNTAPTFIHTALMGDPALRMHPVMPVTNLTLATINQERNVKLNWNKSTDENITGYQVFRSTTRNGNYVLAGNINSSDSTYTDYVSNNGVNYYLVKAVKLETSFSGSYYNTSIGVMDTISTKIYTGTVDLNNEQMFSIYPNPGVSNLMITAQVENAPVTVTLLDLNGRVVARQNWKNVHSTQVLELPAQHLSNGIYLVKIESNQLQSTKKWVLLR